MRAVGGTSSNIINKLFQNVLPKAKASQMLFLSWLLVTGEAAITVETVIREVSRARQVWQEGWGVVTGYPSSRARLPGLLSCLCR